MGSGPINDHRLYDHVDGKPVLRTKGYGSSGSFIYGNVSVTNTATPIYVGAGELAGRRFLIIQPKGSTIYVGFDNTVTAGNNGNGIKVTSNTVLELDVLDNVTVYAIKSGGGSVNCFVGEGL